MAAVLLRVAGRPTVGGVHRRAHGVARGPHVRPQLAARLRPHRLRMRVTVGRARREPPVRAGHAADVGRHGPAAGPREPAARRAVAARAGRAGKVAAFLLAEGSTFGRAMGIQAAPTPAAVPIRASPTCATLSRIVAGTYGWWRVVATYPV